MPMFSRPVRLSTGNSTRKRAVALAMALACATPLSRAQDAVPASPRFVYPAPCVDAASLLLGHAMAQRSAHDLLRALAQQIGEREGWKPGQARYEEAYALVMREVEADEAAHGQADVLGRAYLEAVFRQATPQERRSFQAFLGSDTGRVFWQFAVEEQRCGIMLGVLPGKGAVLSASDRVIMARWTAWLAGGRERYVAAIRPFTPAQQATYRRHLRMLERMRKAESDNRSAEEDERQRLSAFEGFMRVVRLVEPQLAGIYRTFLQEQAAPAGP